MNVWERLTRSDTLEEVERPVEPEVISFGPTPSARSVDDVDALISKWSVQPAIRVQAESIAFDVEFDGFLHRGTRAYRYHHVRVRITHALTRLQVCVAIALTHDGQSMTIDVTLTSSINEGENNTPARVRKHAMQLANMSDLAADLEQMLRACPIHGMELR